VPLLIPSVQMSERSNGGAGLPRRDKRGSGKTSFLWSHRSSSLSPAAPVEQSYSPRLERHLHTVLLMTPSGRMEDCLRSGVKLASPDRKDNARTLLPRNHSLSSQCLAVLIETNSVGAKKDQARELVPWPDDLTQYADTGPWRTVLLLEGDPLLGLPAEDHHQSQDEAANEYQRGGGHYRAD